MPYNVVRDIVNRYVSSIKLFDQQIELGIQMHDLTSFFCRYEYDSSATNLGFQVEAENKIKTRAEFTL